MKTRAAGNYGRWWPQFYSDYFCAWMELPCDSGFDTPEQAIEFADRWFNF